MELPPPPPPLPRRHAFRGYLLPGHASNCYCEHVYSASEHMGMLPNDYREQLYAYSASEYKGMLQMTTASNCMLIVRLNHKGMLQRATASNCMRLNHRHAPKGNWEQYACLWYVWTYGHASNDYCEKLLVYIVRLNHDCMLTVRLRKWACFKLLIACLCVWTTQACFQLLLRAIAGTWACLYLQIRKQQ